MVNLETILTQIQARKIIFDRNKLLSWLNDYASYYKKHYKTRLTKEEIMKRKAKDFLKVADSIYWQYDSVVELKLYPKAKIPEICKEDKQKGVYT